MLFTSRLLTTFPSWAKVPWALLKFSETSSKTDFVLALSLTACWMVALIPGRRLMAESARALLPSICWSNPVKKKESESVQCYNRANSTDTIGQTNVSDHFTFQGIEGAVKLFGVAIDALQSTIGGGLGNVDSVQQLVEILHRKITWN